MVPKSVVYLIFCQLKTMSEKAQHVLLILVQLIQGFTLALKLIQRLTLTLKLGMANRSQAYSEPRRASRMKRRENR